MTKGNVNPKDMTDQKTLMRDMMTHAVHFGHKSAKWNPKMAPYIYGTQKGIHIFDLEHTQAKLKDLCAELQKLSKEGKIEELQLNLKAHKTLSEEKKILAEQLGTVVR